MDKTPVYVLITLGLGKSGEVTRKNVAVTFNIHDAQKHADASFENEYETLSVAADWQEDAANTALTVAMREFRGMVEDMQAEALR